MILRSLNPVKSRKRRRGARSLTAESLERRELLSASSFTINTADLQYIMKQIVIAEDASEAYTADTPTKSITQSIMDTYGMTASDATIAPYGLRTVDGRDNNLVPGQSDFGAADTMFLRLTDPAYTNERDEAAFAGITNTDYALAGNVVDSDPRIISNLISDLSINNPAALQAYLSNPLSLDQFAEDHPLDPTDPSAGSFEPVRPGVIFNAATQLPVTTKDLQTIPNQSPDIGLSPGFNSWMTFFGQFFDHGLDLVTKGGNGTVFMPMQPDDPLIAGADGIMGNADDLPPQLRFMALTRTTPITVNGVTGTENTTTAFIDQNQTYTSHPSHQVFLREYATVAGRTVSTGNLLDGAIAGTIATWADVKAQALQHLGIRLTDFDIHNVPELRTDEYGKFIPNPATGYAQVIIGAGADGIVNTPDDIVISGTPTNPVNPAADGALRTHHAFLNDIAHHAAPGMYDTNGDHVPDTNQTPDTDILVVDDGLASTYDDEMLNSHFVTGDGRGNENIGLTSVHSIFHSEHNRIVQADKLTILRSGDMAVINQWLLTDLTAAEVAAIPTELTALTSYAGTLNWEGERLFQAARFTTEMQYQHLVFEEFARRIQPMVDPFVFNSTPDLNPAITAEFAHTVYRFGHSMLTGTVDRLDNNLELLNGDTSQKTLLAVFLNPQAYLGSGIDAAEINANIIRGTSRDVGNAIDEFVVDDVRSNLLGLPLDLAALNLARGRETGIPSFNQTRAELYTKTGLADLTPYTSWIDFAQNLKNASSVVNFIAAYGTHQTITSQTTLAGKRAAATLIVLGGTGAPADRFEFLNGSDAYAGGIAAAGALGGLNAVDLWIGGLAEKAPEFGGMLGTTFNYVFEAQMENLQFGDRLYYLTRTQGTNFLNQLEPNTFTDLVMRNTTLGDKYSTHLNGALFVTQDHIIELDRGIAQTDYNGAAPGNDPVWDGSNPINEAILGPKVVRTYTGSTVVDATHDVGGSLRVLGGEHYVLGGTEGNDRMWGDKGIDTLWGDGGNDYLNGMTESDNVFGGEGDDIIEDPFGADILRGNQGNDVITSARGADLMFGDEGNDYIVLGQDASEIFAGQGDDFLLGGQGGDLLLGNEGSDWIEGGAGFDTLAGDNSELFFNSKIIGHDVMFGQSNETDYDGESGDDIMGSGASVFRYEGMQGFDWAIGKGDTGPVKFDMQIPFFTVVTDILRDRFDNMEAFSGAEFSDVLDGDDKNIRVAAGLPLNNPANFTNHELTQEGVDRITGFNTWFAGARATLAAQLDVISIDAAGVAVVGVNPFLNGSNFRDGNILIGGDGDDVMQGRAGNDLIDGDALLNVRIRIVHNGITYSAESMNTDTAMAGPYAGKVFNTDVNGNPIFTSPAFGGRSLTSLMLDRTLNPGEMSIVREIKYDSTMVTGFGMNTDTAVYRGNYAQYDIEGRITSGPDGSGAVIRKAFDVNGDGFISVHDRDNGVTGATVGGVTLRSRGILTDGTDLLKNVEQLKFADQTIRIAEDPTTLDLSAFANFNVREEFGTTSYTVSDTANATTAWTTAWTETGDVTTGAINTAGQIRISSLTNALLLGDNHNEATGLGNATIQRVVDLSSQTSATLSYSYSELNFDAGEIVTVSFSANGTTFVTLQTIDSNSNTGTFSTALTGPFTANGVLRFVVSGTNNSSALDVVSIDDINFAGRTPSNNGTLNYLTTFTEDLASVAIGVGVGITDSDTTHLGAAKIVLTNAKADDVLSISGNLPAGISFSIDLSVPGVITMNLTGNATLADYQTAIQAVRFANISQRPDVTQRLIKVTAGDSNIATATVNVISVNDLTTAGTDRVLLNVASTDFAIPNWAFLANDSDADDVLGISAVSLPVNVANLSLLTNPGSITLQKTGAAAGSFQYTVVNALATVNVVLDIDAMAGDGTNEIIVGSAGVNTIAGNAGNDIIFGLAGNDTITGGAGADRLIGGDGIDAIDPGGNDAAVDVVQYSQSSEFGDTITNFRATTAGQIDVIKFGGELNVLFDDGTNDDVFTFVSGNGANGGDTPVNLNATTEGLYLNGLNTEGVATGDLTNATAVATEFNAEFAMTAADGEATLLVINDTNANSHSAAVWQWIQAGGGEITAGELTRIATVTANATITTASFGFYAEANLRAAALGNNTNAAVLTTQQASSMLAAAVSRFKASGINTAALKNVNIRIANLGGTTLGFASGNTIWLDDNAAGWGWFVDQTPLDDSEFLLSGDQGEQNRIDLLTVIEHELGHILGLEHTASGLMTDSLAIGRRQTLRRLIGDQITENL